jgi:hypothetical protein
MIELGEYVADLYIRTSRILCEENDYICPLGYDCAGKVVNKKSVYIDML